MEKTPWCHIQPAGAVAQDLRTCTKTLAQHFAHDGKIKWEELVAEVGTYKSYKIRSSSPAAVRM